MKLRTVAVLAACVSQCLCAARASWTYLPVGKPWIYSIAVNETESRMISYEGWSGLWRTSNGGASWIPFTNEFAADSRASGFEFQYVDPAGDTILADIYRIRQMSAQNWYSYDGGTNWQHAPDSFADQYGTHMIALSHHHNLWIHSGRDSLRHSTDYGQTWVDPPVHLPKGGNYCLFEDRFRDSTVYLTTYFDRNNGDSTGGLWRTDNLGATWSPMVNFRQLFPNSNNIMVTGGAQLDTNTFVLIADINNETLIRTTDGGQSWTICQDGLPACSYPREVVADRGAPGHVYYLDILNGLYRSTDSGQTWNLCSNGLPVHGEETGQIYQNPYSLTVYVTLGGEGVFRSTDHGESWQPVVTTSHGSPGRFDVLPSSVYYTDKSNRLWRLNSTMNGWDSLATPQAPDSVTDLVQVVHQSGDSLIAYTRRETLGSCNVVGSMAYSYDGGYMWTFGPHIDFYPDNPLEVFINSAGTRLVRQPGESPGFHVSEDLGTTWIPVTPPAGGDIWASAQDDSAIYGLAIIWTGNLDVMRAQPPDWTWQSMGYPGGGQFQAICVNNGEVYVLAHDTCWAYTNQHWEMRGSLDTWVAELLCVSGEHPVLLGGLTYAWDGPAIEYSPDLGFSWQMRDFGTPLSPNNWSFNDLKYDPWREVVWGASALGPCYLPLSDLDTPPAHAGSMPREIQLSVFPNPTNAAFDVTFTITRAGKTELTLYDVLGRRVRSLWSGIAKSGSQTINVDCASLASGAYFVRLKASGEQQIRKLSIVR